MVAQTVSIAGANGDQIGAYIARPTTPGDHPAVVLIHSAPGCGDWYHEATLRFARRGYIAICSNLYHRLGHGSVEEVSARVREAGGVADAEVVGDVHGAMQHVRGIAGHNGKVGVIGSCSGGRHSYLVACQTPDLDAAVDLWGGGVVARPEELTPKRPVAAIDMTQHLNAPLLGIFGNDDANPSPEAVDTLEVALRAAGKQYAFHRYDGAGHGFMHYDGANYR
ncbi:MAG: dienelactone hydrolase family protein [Dehalococcoidia bacterium]|nr:dienelactone hydrolase family protein [Dehalococcoidia bacterium]